MSKLTDKDFTSSGLKLEGAYENDRNSQSSQLFKDIIHEVYGVKDVIIGHHLIFELRDKRRDGFTYDVVQELPSADALIFDHGVAQHIFGDRWKVYLQGLALEPVETRDQLLASLYYDCHRKDGQAHSKLETATVAPMDEIKSKSHERFGDAYIPLG